MRLNIYLLRNPVIFSIAGFSEINDPGGNVNAVPSSFTSFVKHIHPAKIPLKALELKSTWALGGICLVLVMILMGSGILMLFSYQPFPERAYNSVQFFENQFIFGRLIRSIHYFAANLLVVTLFCHMLRVFFTGGFMETRRINWIIGICIFGLALLSCFTGYLLPWDQTAFWAVTICINVVEYIPGGGLFKDFLMNGIGINEKTLQLFFTLHTTLIPCLVILLLGIHFWKIRKAKGVVTAGLPLLEGDTPPVMVKTNPNLLLREVVVALIVVAVVIVPAFVFNAPLGDMANAGLSPNPAKAPWYFAGFQELLLHFHPFFAVFLVPLLFVCILVWMSFKKWDAWHQGIWFISSKGKKAVKTAVFFSVILTPCLVLLDDYVIDFQTWFPGISPVLATGLIPFCLCLMLILVFHFSVKKKLRLSPSEAFQSSAVLLITAFILLTIICSGLRGAGMKLNLWGA